MILSQGITTTTKTLIMNKQTQYEKYRETILAYGKTRVECECGDTLNRNSFSKHKKTQKHKDKMSELENQPNSLAWFLYQEEEESESEEEEIVLEKGTFTKDIVFHCSGCFEGIVRDSKKHDECQMIKNVWICGECF